VTQPIWLAEADVVSLLDLRQAIGALEHGLAAEARGQAASMAKTHLAWDDNNLHAIGARLDDYVGTKTWAHTEGGTCPLLILFDAKTGQLAAIIEAFALGQLRTGGISGLATDWMAKPGAKTMALVGTGKQALPQVAAVAVMRSLTELRVFSPRAESRQAFIERARTEFDFEITGCESVREAVRGAEIVTLVTRARAPVLAASMLEPGAHLNAVGAITPEREEFAQDVFGRVTAVAVDSLPAVQKLSKEFVDYYAGRGWDAVRPLSALIASGRRRQAADDLSLFKAMGTGVSDLSLGVELIARARARGAGRPIPTPQKVKPRLAAKAAV